MTATWTWDRVVYAADGVMFSHFIEPDRETVMQLNVLNMMIGDDEILGKAPSVSVRPERCDTKRPGMSFSGMQECECGRCIIVWR